MFPSFEVWIIFTKNCMCARERERQREKSKRKNYEPKKDKRTQTIRQGFLILNTFFARLWEELNFLRNDGNDTIELTLIAFPLSLSLSLPLYAMFVDRRYWVFFRLFPLSIFPMPSFTPSQGIVFYTFKEEGNSKKTSGKKAKKIRSKKYENWLNF